MFVTIMINESNGGNEVLSWFSNRWLNPEIHTHRYRTARKQWVIAIYISGVMTNTHKAFSAWFIDARL